TLFRSLLVLAHACYLVDRVKISDDRQDPADALALPDRTIFHVRHASQLRALICLEFLLASVIGYLIHPLLATIPIGALIGVYMYAGRGATPGKPRLKDYPALKSFFIASAHLALVIALLWGNGHLMPERPHTVVALSLLGVWLIVSADAILCDLDDRESDSIYATRSLPVLIGPRHAWLVAMTVLFFGVLAISIHRASQTHLAFVAVMIFLSGVPTLHRKNRRDLIDARLLPVVAVGFLIR
ncbi:MAG: UbiA family prenyltransferase, partial [Phycisphaerales bacterium]